VPAKPSSLGETTTRKVAVPMSEGHRVADFVRREILTGKLAPGTRVRQEELAAQVGSSRIPVREALRQLEAEGLVVLIANSGAWVAKLDMKECIEAHKILERLEPLALAESVINLTAADIAELERIADAIEQSRDVDSLLRLDRDFHLLSYSRSSLPMLQSLILRFWNTTLHYRHAYYLVRGDADRRIIYADHRLMLESISIGDVEEAERVLQGHIRRSRIRLQRHTELFS
jgi:DNA-binding GntR family transcriptional regulator